MPMTSSQIKRQILERLDELSEGDQRQVLRYAETLTPARGEGSGEELLRFAGTIDPEDCRRMQETIEAGCERVDPRDW
jgi:replication-associated recombination protein RarA